MSKSSVYFFLVLFSCHSFAQTKPIATQEEVLRSNLDETEKGLATMAILSDPIVECFSNNEAIGSSDQDRLNIYRLDFGLTVVVRKHYQDFNLGINEYSVVELHDAFAENESIDYYMASEENTYYFNLKAERNIPFLGKATVLSLGGKDFGYICKMY